VSLIDAETLKVVDSIDVEDGPRAYGNSIGAAQAADSTDSTGDSD